MKVFAVTKNEAGELELLTFNSQKEFLSTYDWCDERLLKTATTDDYKNGRYQEEETYVSPDEPLTKGSMRIVYTKEQVEVRNMLHRALKAHFKGQTFSPNWS